MVTAPPDLALYRDLLKNPGIHKRQSFGEGARDRGRPVALGPPGVPFLQGTLPLSAGLVTLGSLLVHLLGTEMHERGDLQPSNGLLSVFILSLSIG